MTRYCSYCGKNISIEPAIVGINGLLCFPCRYKIDVQGGEQYLSKLKNYRIVYSEWFNQYHDMWTKHIHYKKFTEAFEIAVGIGTIIALLAIYKENGFFIITGILIFVLFFLLRYIYSKLSLRFICPAPPDRPKPNKFILSSNPEIVFNESNLYENNKDFVNYEGGYPPDWEERKKKCVERDLRECRICYSQDRLHIHHVKPVSFGGNHSLQNLITLCKTCHYKQKYYRHNELVTENIKAGRKYFVKNYIRRDGIWVKGHTRKVGRRGKFWRQIRRRRKY